MIDDIIELSNQSEKGDKLSQINLFFKQYYDLDNRKAAILTCDKWRQNNLFLEGVWIYYGFCEYESTDVDCCYEGNKSESSAIFNQLINDENTEDEIRAHAYNMRALCLGKHNLMRETYFTFAVKQGIVYAHNNLAVDSTDVESKIRHYEIAAAKYNKCAILNLAQIYLTSDTYMNPALAMEYYKRAVKCGYDLGSVETLLKLENYDINLTIQLLEYEINRKNHMAMLALATIYANNVTLFDQKLNQCEISPSEYDNCVIPNLAQIYIRDIRPMNPPLAIKCYQTMMKCEYSLGCVRTILELSKHDINITRQLLEYEINKKNNWAILALANLYASHDILFDRKLALDYYSMATNIPEFYTTNIDSIIKTRQIDWSPKYHIIWPTLNIKIVKTCGFGKTVKTRTVANTNFQGQVVLLMLITKYRHLSNFTFTKLMYKNIVLAIITQLAKIWIDDTIID